MAALWHSYGSGQVAFVFALVVAGKGISQDGQVAFVFASCSSKSPSRSTAVTFTDNTSWACRHLEIWLAGSTGYQTT